MKVTLLGTGFAVPSVTRAQSGLIAETADTLLLFDCGSGVLRRIVQAGHDVTEVDAVVLSHFHLDHTADLLPLMKARWIKGVKDMTMIGPVGLGQWLEGLFGPYPYMKDRMDLKITEMAPGERTMLLDAAIECAPAHHAPESLAYRLDSPSGSMVYSGDTEPCEGMKSLCREGADLLVHECSYLVAGNGGHTTPLALAGFLSGMPIKKVVITHLAPETGGHEEEMARILSDGFGGTVLMGEDLTVIRI